MITAEESRKMRSDEAVVEEWLNLVDRHIRKHAKERNFIDMFYQKSKYSSSENLYNSDIFYSCEYKTPKGKIFIQKLQELGFKIEFKEPPRVSPYFVISW
jgi:hypothetical protein